MSNDISVFPLALLENAVTRPIAYQGEEVFCLATTHRQTRGRADRYFLLVGLSHPLFQTGLSRRSANLLHSDRNSVYGILAIGTHAELSRLYAHARDVLGETYLPEAVLTETLDGKYKPALCYICPEMMPRLATNDYINRIVTPARKYGFS
jgi:hypothetical protein